MLGDWVKSRGKIEQVREVYDGFICTDSFEDSHDYYFEPIPLTEEILQKNFPTPEEIVWWPLKDGSFRVEMQDDTHLIIGKYNYVHELQHALRLFGKDGEINYEKARLIQTNHSEVGKGRADRYVPRGGGRTPLRP